MKIMVYLLCFLTDFLTAAHFLRFNSTFFFVLFLIFPFLMLIKKRWIDFIVLLSLVASVIIFLKTTYVVTDMRIQSGLDYHRFFVIMAVVLTCQIAGVFLFLYYSKVRSKHV